MVVATTPLVCIMGPMMRDDISGPVWKVIVTTT